MRSDPTSNDSVEEINFEEEQYTLRDLLTDLKCFYQLLSEDDFITVKNLEQKILLFIEELEACENGLVTYNSDNYEIEVIFSQFIREIGKVILSYENDKITLLWHGLRNIGNRFKFLNYKKLRDEFTKLGKFIEILQVQQYFNVSKRLYSDFDNIQELGKGGFGKVVCARHKVDEVKYALKIIKTSNEKLPQCISEVHILSVLNHPNIVQYKTSWLETTNSVLSDDESDSNDSSGHSSYSEDISQLVESPSDNMMTRHQKSDTEIQAEIESISPSNRIIYIQMEKCDMTLKFWLDHRQSLSLPSSKDFPLENRNILSPIDVLLAMSKALEYIHSRGIVHHDITPANIFVNFVHEKPRFMLADFGLACSKRQESKCLSKGTFTYSIPDNFEVKCHPKNDLYSLGIIAYEVALQCSTQAEFHHRLSQLKSYTANNEDKAVSPNLWNIITKLTERNTEKRPSATELMQMIEELKMETVDLNSEIQQLKEELQEKNRQLLEKDLQLRRKDEQFQEINDYVTKLLEKLKKM